MPGFCLSSTIARFNAAFLIDTFTVQAFTLTSDGSGGQVQAWSDQTAGVAGMLEPSQYRPFQEPAAGGHQQEERRWAITLEQGTVVDASKRIKQTHSNGIAITARIFKIYSVMDGETFDMSVDCECVELPNLA